MISRATWVEFMMNVCVCGTTRWSFIPGRGPVLEFTFQGTRLACVSDREHDRMRIIAPIRRQSELSADQIVRILEANFHTALDARYATSEGVLYAAE